MTVMSTVEVHFSDFMEDLLIDQIESAGLLGGVAVSFEDTTINRSYFSLQNLPKFRFAGTRWKRDEFSGVNRRVRFPNTIPLALQEEQARQLRRALASNGNAEMANEFLLSEVESRRLQLSRKQLDWWVLTVHKYLSYYNARFLRPLFWLLILLIVAPSIHMMNGFLVSEIDRGAGITRYIEYDVNLIAPTPVNQVLRDGLDALVFTVASMTLRSVTDYRSASLGSRIARTIGQSLGPVLVLVFVFSLRRRFHIPSGYS